MGEGNAGYLFFWLSLFVVDVFGQMALAAKKTGVPGGVGPSEAIALLKACRHVKRLAELVEHLEAERPGGAKFLVALWMIKTGIPKK